MDEFGVLLARQLGLGATAVLKASLCCHDPCPPARPPSSFQHPPLQLGIPNDRARIFNPTVRLSRDPIVP